MTGQRRRTARGLRRAQARITAITVALLLVVLVAGAALILAVYRNDQLRRVDDQLQADKGRVALLADAYIAIPKGTPIDDRVQLIDDAGQVAFAGQPLEGEDALWVPGRPTQPQTVQSEMLGEVRIVATRFKGWWLVLAEPLRPVERDAEALGNVMLLALPALLLAVGARGVDGGGPGSAPCRRRRRAGGAAPRRCQPRAPQPDHRHPRSCSRRSPTTPTRPSSTASTPWPR